MKNYIFEHKLNSNIIVNIKAGSYTHAMELLLSISRYIEDFKLVESHG